MTLAGVTRSDESQSVGLIFLHTFQLIWIKLDVVLEQLKLHSLILTLSKIYQMKRITETLTLACIQTFIN